MKNTPQWIGTFCQEINDIKLIAIIFFFSTSIQSQQLQNDTMANYSKKKLYSGKNITNDWSYYGKEEVKKYQIQNEYKVKSQEIFSLREAKKAIINGDLHLAHFFLSKINTNSSKLLLIRNRYLSLLKFIEGDYKSSYDLISSNEYDSDTYYQQICLLRVINLIALNENDKFKKEIITCPNSTIEYSTNDHFWLRQIRNIKEKNNHLLKGKLLSQLRQSINNDQYLKLWIKVALYINKEDIIIDNLSYISPASYKDKELRELIGFAYYRLGNLKKAEEFIEDIESPNADNIRGSINLKNNKLELAFGHFKLALNKKQNSKNALERGIPLAYLLGLWDEGLLMLKRSVMNKDSTNKKALEMALNIRKGNIKKSREIFNILEDKFNKELPYELLLMDTFITIKESNQVRLIDTSARGCSKQEGLHCWLYAKVLEWENLGKTLTRTDKTLTLKFDIEELKQKNKITPLRDINMIDQEDIEELDGKEINLAF